MKKANNKGFTLVELIIVVAIIAVLAAVLAPQYLRYVERARQSNDLQVATSIMRATTAAISDPQVGVASSETITVSWVTGPAAHDPDGAGTFTVGATDATSATNIRNEILQTMGWATVSDTGAVSDLDISDAQSAAGNAQPFSFTVDASTGQITIATGSARWVDDIGVSQPKA